MGSRTPATPDSVFERATPTATPNSFFERATPTPSNVSEREYPAKDYNAIVSRQLMRTNDPLYASIPEDIGRQNQGRLLLINHNDCLFCFFAVVLLPYGYFWLQLLTSFLLHWIYYLHVVVLISSPEPKAHQWAYRIPMDPASVRPSVLPSSSVRSHFQTSSPLKPLGQSKPNFMWSLLGKGERKFV